MEFIIYHFPLKWLIVCMSVIYCVQRSVASFKAKVSMILVAQNSHSSSVVQGLLININVSRMASPGAKITGIRNSLSTLGTKTVC